MSQFKWEVIYMSGRLMSFEFDGDFRELLDYLDDARIEPSSIVNVRRVPNARGF